MSLSTSSGLAVSGERLFSKMVVEEAFSAKLTFVFSLRPLVEDHMILAPKRRVSRLSELTAEEAEELFASIPRLQASLRERDVAISAFNVAMKDGAAAGQLPSDHAHVHVLPRRRGDLQRNDDIYDLLENWRPDDEKSEPTPFEVPDDSDRRPRTADDMASEAADYRDTHFKMEGPVNFGKFVLDPRQVFFATKLTMAIVNLKPLVPGHVLVVPRRVVQHLRDLTEDEALDLWQSLRHVHQLILDKNKKTSANIAVQDGKDAGQSVPHVHVHLLPR